MLNPQRSEVFFTLRAGVPGTRQSLEIMASVVRGYEHDPTVQDQARSIVSFLPGRAHEHEVNAVFEWVRDNVRYVGGPLDVEQVHTPDVTLEDQQGKCTDQSVLLASLLRSLGYGVKFVATAYQIPGVFEHVYVKVKIGADWVALDTTIPLIRDCGMLHCPGTFGYEPPGALSRIEWPI